MLSKIPVASVVVIAVYTVSCSATFSSDSGKAAGQMPTLGKMIGDKIDGIQALKGMLLSPFLALASGLLTQTMQMAPAPAPDPAPSPADSYYAAPPPAPAYASSYAETYGNDGSYSNIREQLSNGGGTGSSSSNDASKDIDKHELGDTGKTEDGLKLAITELTDNPDGSAPIKRGGTEIVFLTPDNFEGASGYRGAPYYAPYGNGNEMYYGNPGYQIYTTKSKSKSKSKSGIKGFDIGIGLHKSFEIRWPTKGAILKGTSDY